MLRNIWTCLNAEKCPGDLWKLVLLAEFLKFSDNTWLLDLGNLEILAKL